MIWGYPYFRNHPNRFWYWKKGTSNLVLWCFLQDDPQMIWFTDGSSFWTREFIVFQLWCSQWSILKSPLDPGSNVSKSFVVADFETRKYSQLQTKSRWWFQIFFIFIPTWGRFPIWPIFFKWVETTPCFFVSKLSTLHDSILSPQKWGIFRWRNPEKSMKKKWSVSTRFINRIETSLKLNCKDLGPKKGWRYQLSKGLFWSVHGFLFYPIFKFPYIRTVRTDVPSLKLTENRPLEVRRFLLETTIFSGELLVSGSFEILVVTCRIPKSPSKVPEKYMPKSVNPATETPPRCFKGSRASHVIVSSWKCVLITVFEDEMLKYKEESLQIHQGKET